VVRVADSGGQPASFSLDLGVVAGGLVAQIGKQLATYDRAIEAKQAATRRDRHDLEAVPVQMVVKYLMAAVHELAAGFGVDAIVERRAHGQDSAAHTRLRFEHPDTHAGPGQRDCCRQTGQSRADYDDIGLVRHLASHLITPRRRFDQHA
jgi:hypothetical protein